MIILISISNYTTKGKRNKAEDRMTKKREMKTFPFVPGTRENVYMCTVS